MNKKLYITKKILPAEGRLEYYLIESRYNDIKEGISGFVFGVEIVKINEDGSGVEYIQRSRVCDLSCDRERVTEFLYLIAENNLMPVNLTEVAADFAKDGFFINVSRKKKTA